MAANARHYPMAATVLAGLGSALLSAAAPAAALAAEPAIAPAVEAAIERQIQSAVDAAMIKAMPSARRLAANTELQSQLPTGAEEIEARNRVFRERVARAVESHPALAGFENRRAENAEGVNEAEAALYPQVGMRLSGGHSVTKPGGDFRSAAHGRTDLVVTARQLIYDFGATFGRIDAARFEERARSFEVLTTAKQLTLDAIDAYLTVITLRDQVSLTKKNVAKHEAIANMVIDRIEAKVAPLSDINQVNSRLAAAEAQMSAYIGDLGRAEAMFKELFDEDAGPILFPVIDLALSPNTDQTLIAAVGAHPQMKMHEMQVLGAKRMSQAARGDNLPRLMLEADVTRYDIDPTSSSGGTDTGKPYGAVIRFNVIYDFFDGGAGKARENKAMFRAAKVQNDRDVFQRGLSRRIRYAYADAGAKKDSIKALKLSVQASQGTVFAYGRKYNIGRLSLIDLLDAQADLYQAAMDFNGGRADLLLAKFGVLMLVGGLLDYFDVDAAKFLDVSVPSAPTFKEIFTGGLLEYFNIDVTKFLDSAAPDAPDIKE